MHTTHYPLAFPHHTLHGVDFDATTLRPADLLWLPYPALLNRYGHKRQAEHLAGRIAAVHALREVGEKRVPHPGDRGQPLWPAPWFGSISHCDNTALAVVSHEPVGVDIERLFDCRLAQELENSVITPAERLVIAGSDLAFELALTVVFSAKESVFKAFSHQALEFPVFLRAKLLKLPARAGRGGVPASSPPKLENKLILINWLKLNDRIITCTAPANEA
ncbi:enterobactin synthase subunit EntD [Kluyvera sichuanensis]|uniref:enterobactin synthase subunit EntD n=1 Tax=Kluyvera sichuanensis TaxID=2725494 RepID=UPI0039F54050